MRIELDDDGITIDHGPAGCDDSELEHAQTTWDEWGEVCETDTLIIVVGKTDMVAVKALEAHMKQGGTEEPFETKDPVTKTTKSFYRDGWPDTRLKLNELETVQCTARLVLPKACVQGMPTDKFVRKIQSITAPKTTD